MSMLFTLAALALFAVSLFCTMFAGMAQAPLILCGLLGALTLGAFAAICEDRGL